MDTLEFVNGIFALKGDKLSNDREKAVAIALDIDKFVSEKTKDLEEKLRNVERRLNSLEAYFN